MLICVVTNRSVRKAIADHLPQWSAQGASLMLFELLAWFTDPVKTQPAFGLNTLQKLAYER